jgi:hypothetical protein
VVLGYERRWLDLLEIRVHVLDLDCLLHWKERQEPSDRVGCLRLEEIRHDEEILRSGENGSRRK